MHKLVTGAVILAAGESSRLGYPKQEVVYEGKALLQRAAKAVLDGCDGPVMVVLGAHASRMRKLLSTIESKNLHVVENHYWKDGMGSSIACGISALLKVDERLDGAIVSLCDQPHLGSDNIRKLCARFSKSPDRIIASAYASTMGPPVMFPRSFFRQLLLCSGDKGARKILKQHADSVHTIDFPELAQDIDTPEQHQQL